jgi:hypothetical protein
MLNSEINQSSRRANRFSYSMRWNEIVSKNEEEGIANLMGSITPTIARDMIAVCGAPKKIEKTGNSRNRDETI